jgi:hypothetical protein
MAEGTRVVGADTIAAGLGRSAAALPDIAEAVSEEVAGRIRTDAARAAPHRTGRLAASGQVRPRSGAGFVTSFGSSQVGYAPAQNWGTGPRTGLRGPHSVRATHFFSDAVTKNTERFADDIADETQKSLDKIKGA